ncbi:type II secretion system protein [Methylophaga sp.]|uniref:type II secretion system protein n=1 Tax=Methylophaga sp. TaxID=2024840 RepID=UPI003A92FDE0
MNIKQMKSMISKFRSADVSVIKDADMRAKAQKLQNKQGGFTLLELLVVVAILAIIAGAVISSLDGQEELAAQKTTVHTMAAMEEAFQVYRVSEKRRLPGGLDSLLCVTGADASNATLAYSAYANTSNLTLLGAPNNSNVARVGGGLTRDLADKLEIGQIPNAIAEELIDEGLTSIRVAEAGFCNDVADDAASGIEDTALVDVVKPNLIFQNAIVEDGEWEFGGGVELALNSYTDASAALPVAVLREAAEITGSEEDIIAVFAIGPGSEIIGDYIARAPSDGNVGPDKYGNFSVAVKIAECNEDIELGDAGCPFDGSSGWNESDIKVVAILDGGGDAYDDEIAEARGNQEE